MAVYSVCSTRMASATTAAPKAAIATFTVVPNDNTDAGYFQENLGKCSQWHVHCKITWKWIPHVQNNILTAASVRHYNYSLRNNPEWSSFQLLRSYVKNSYRKGISQRRLPRVWLRTQYNKEGLVAILQTPVEAPGTVSCYIQDIRSPMTTTEWRHSKWTQYQFPAAVLLSHRQFCTATPHVH